MTIEELRQAAIDYLGAAMKGDDRPEAHVVQAAVSIVLTLTPTPKSK